MQCDECFSLDGERIDDDTVLCEKCNEEIRNHLDRIETEQDAMKDRY